VPVAEGADLYGLPLEQFIAERTLLAKALRAEKRRDEAAAVAGLRKPSVAAWAVNQLVRTQIRDVQALFDAGDEVRRVQDELLAGDGDAVALRDATERQRAAVGALLDLARGLLSGDGHELTQMTMDRVADTLQAGALDPQARALIGDGRLERELKYASLGGRLAPAAAAVPASTTRETGSSTSREPAKATRDARALEPQRRERRQRLEHERSERVKLARRAESEARAALDLAERALAAARRRRDLAADALRDADDSLAATLRRATAAGDAHRVAKAEAERAERPLLASPEAG
jgi:hypothetical protein